jgi:hypothetical protein
VLASPIEPKPKVKSRGRSDTPDRIFFLARCFRNLEDLNSQFDHWCREIANARVHATTGRVVAEAFAEEQPALIALPALAYSAVLTIERRVSHEGMVAVGGNFYSVPDSTRRRTVDVQHHPKEIRIFEDGRLIASHPVLEGKKQRRVDPQHRQPPLGRTLAPAKQGVARRPLEFYDAVGQRLAREVVR